MNIFKLFPFFVILIVFNSCNSSKEKSKPETASERKITENTSNPRKNSKQFKAYWYTGKAEITSYKLQQELYGELREGTAVTVFVTEDFLPDSEVKANSASKKNLSVLKLNLTKKFNTGFYPYSIMNSTFSPITNTNHALKVSNSVQEWCGQRYMQLNNKEDFEIQSHSYFEGEADQSVLLKKNWLENELWNLIRINPVELPTGDIMIIPSFEYLQLHHKKIKSHNAFASLKQGDSITTYTLNYPDLQRQLMLYFYNNFPYEIEKWEEINMASKNDTLRLKTTAIKMKRIVSDYWSKTGNNSAKLRDSLNLK